MAKDKITEYDATAANNTDVGGVNLQESSMLPSDVNNAIRELMSHQKEAFGSGTPLFVDQTNNRVVIGESAPDTSISGGTPAFQVIGSAFDSFMSLTRRVASASAPVLALTKSRNTSVGSHTIVQDDDVIGEIVFFADDGTDLDSRVASIKAEVDGTPGANDTPGRLVFMTSADGSNSPTERMRVDSSGNLLVGKTSADISTVGLELKANNAAIFTRSGSTVLYLNRTSDDGAILELRKDNSAIGSLGSINGDLFIGTGDTGIRFHDGDNRIYTVNTANGAKLDGAIDLGEPAGRWEDIYATNGTIQTSDKNEKQDIEELTDAEKRVAVVAKGLLRKYRWKDAVAKKGDNARIHFGIIAQDLQDAFTAESLDASRYGMFCSNTWWEKEISVDAVEADEEKGIEAKDAYTYMDTKDEATEGYTEKTRLGVRYSELLAFIISAI